MDRDALEAEIRQKFEEEREREEVRRRVTKLADAFRELKDAFINGRNDINKRLSTVEGQLDVVVQSVTSKASTVNVHQGDKTRFEGIQGDAEYRKGSE